MHRTRVDIGGLLNAAAAGDLVIDPAAGTELAASIGRVRERVHAAVRRIDESGGQYPALGTLPEAEAIARRDARVESGDPRSLRAELVRYLRALDGAQQAVRVGMANHHNATAGRR